MTFQVEGQPDVWAQVTFDEVNVFYPSSREPEEELAEHEQLRLDAVELAHWEPNKFATFTHSRDVNAVAEFLDVYLERVCLKGRKDFGLNVTLQDLS